MHNCNDKASAGTKREMMLLVPVSMVMVVFHRTVCTQGWAAQSNGTTVALCSSSNRTLARLFHSDHGALLHNVHMVLWD